ncbi:MAG: hypothetical protein PVJ83_00625, partial [Gammaproteobacteria bacterium]
SLPQSIKKFDGICINCLDIINNDQTNTCRLLALSFRSAGVGENDQRNVNLVRTPVFQARRTQLAARIGRGVRVHPLSQKSAIIVWPVTHEQNGQQGAASDAENLFRHQP